VLTEPRQARHPGTTASDGQPERGRGQRRPRSVARPAAVAGRALAAGPGRSERTGQQRCATAPGDSARPVVHRPADHRVAGLARGARTAEAAEPGIAVPRRPERGL
ncbi:hypothetical protein, partial [Pseudomonas sp. FEN]